MKKIILKIGFIACLVLSAIFAVLLLSNSMIMSNVFTNGWSPSKYQNLVKTDTILLFVFGIGAIIFKSIEILKDEKGEK